MKNIHLLLILGVVLGAGLLLARGKEVWPFAKTATTTSPAVYTASNTATSSTSATSTSTPISKPAPHSVPKTVPPALKTNSGITGSVTIGPTCPVERIPPEPSCADKPYQTTLVIASTIIGRNGGVLVQTDAKGHFTKELLPGTYTIRAASERTPPTLAPVTVTVKEGAWTNVDLSFDSGIR